MRDVSAGYSCPAPMNWSTITYKNSKFWLENHDARLQKWQYSPTHQSLFISWYTRARLPFIF